MKDFQNIIDDYQQGNFEERLNLFLECRDFRNEFIQIEQDEAKSKKEEAAVKPAYIYSNDSGSAFFPFRRLLRWCHSFMH